MPPPAGAASPTVALPWGGSSTDRATLPPPASAVWSRFHDGGSLSSVSRVEAKELTERVAHLERDRGVLVAELQAAQQVRADWEAALSAAEAKVLHERGEHAAAVALLRTQLAGARAELEAVRGELVQVCLPQVALCSAPPCVRLSLLPTHLPLTHPQAQRTAQAARSEAEQAVGPEVAALQARCATAEAASAAAQSAARALRAERGASTEPRRDTPPRPDDALAGPHRRGCVCCRRCPAGQACGGERAAGDSRQHHRPGAAGGRAGSRRRPEDG